MKEKMGLFFCVLFVFMLFFNLSSVQAEEQTGIFTADKSGNGGGLDFEIKGVNIKFNKIGNRNDYYFNVILSATSQEDMVLTLSKKECIAYDYEGNEFNIYNINIGNKDTSERRIIKDVPTKIYFIFSKSGEELADKFARIDLNIMEEVVTLRDVVSSK